MGFIRNNTVRKASSQYFVDTDAWAIRVSPASMIQRCLHQRNHFVHGYKSKKYYAMSSESFENMAIPPVHSVSKLLILVLKNVHSSFKYKEIRYRIRLISIRESEVYWVIINKLKYYLNLLIEEIGAGSYPSR